METAMIINILPQTKANVVVASVEDKLKILASCNISRGVEPSWLQVGCLANQNGKC